MDKIKDLRVSSFQEKPGKPILSFPAKKKKKETLFFADVISLGSGLRGANFLQKKKKEVNRVYSSIPRDLWSRQANEGRLNFHWPFWNRSNLWFVESYISQGFQDTVEIRKC